MSTTEPISTLRRERALRAARLRLRRLEIETHRIKAELARLEAEFEDDVADRLSQTLRPRGPRSDDVRLDDRHDEPLVSAGVRASGFDVGPLDQGPHRPPALSRPAGRSEDGTTARAARRRESPWPQIVVDSRGGAVSSRVAGRPSGKADRRRTTRPLAMSLAFHVLVLLACLRLTFPILGQPQVSLFASPTVFPDDPSIELSEIEFEQKEWDDLQTRQVVFEETQLDFADDLLSDLLPAEPAADTATLTDLGLMDADLGGRAARGSGDAAAGGRGGPLGATTFFGTRSRGDRLVFVVDNSSSMKGGRLEAAVVELVRSINAMVPRQSFYVIFVSDQTYPMFYPDRAADLAPATAANKKLLGEWLQKVRLASGKNRELITAMDLAASLRPHAVFLLWDGRIDDQTVRRDVLTHLTRPNQWNFPIHTLGTGTLAVESEQNLAAIAQAHGGVYRRVAIPQPSGR